MITPTNMIDPVCGMTVRVETAEHSDLTIEHQGRTYAFCQPGCRRAFLEAPDEHAARAAMAALSAADATVSVAATTPGPAVIDEGMRRWYESCACCLSDAYPEIKAQLDAEREATAQSPVDAGICEVAEAEA